MMRSRSLLSSRAEFKESQKQRLRVFQRASIHGEVLIHNDEQLYIATLDNISAGGLFIEDLINMRKGSKVRIVVRSPKLDTTVQAAGTVVRIEKKSRRGTAIEFTSISSRAREIIQNCVFEARMEAALKVV